MTDKKAAKFDQNIYEDSTNYANVIGGEEDSRIADIDAKLKQGREASRNALIKETMHEGGENVIGDLTQE